MSGNLVREVLNLILADVVAFIMNGIGVYTSLRPCCCALESKELIVLFGQGILTRLQCTALCPNMACFCVVVQVAVDLNFKISRLSPMAHSRD